MKRKRLGSLTIIPPSLYVERGADRQVDQIIQHMGRPGYVLVARQMGKTNLLLNARRKVANGTDVFVYLDLSNTFPDVRSFFRNVTDTIFDSSTAELQIFRDEVVSARDNIDRPPHKEHEWELRVILQHLPGKLVVCLDEIDALTKVEYSDQVFSFIRSVYFSGRSNFSEFESLTYILSGVAEPADIIKNRDISPFNIGEKILLEDFSLKEVATLLGKAEMNLPDACLDRVYYWTNGHPRMTWDLCSEIEDRLAQGAESVSPKLVDDAVQHIYFSDLDVPPVDQIKRQTHDSKEIRDALIAVHYGRGDAISDGMRTRLYLAGVSRIAPKDRAVGFKNKILEEALSERFLLSINSDAGEDPVAVGQRLLESGDFDRAIDTLTRVANNVVEENVRARARFGLGRAYFFVGDYGASVAELTLALPGLAVETSPLCQLFLGVAHFRQGNYRDAMRHLECLLDLSEKGSTSHIRFEAIVDWSYSSARTKSSEALTRAAELCKSIISGSEPEVLSKGGITRPPGQTMASAYDAMAAVMLVRGMKNEAKAELDVGLRYASGDLRIRMLLAQSEVDHPRRNFYLQKCLAFTNAATEFSRNPYNELSSISFVTCYRVMAALDKARMKDDLKSMVEHVLTTSANRHGVIDVVQEAISNLVTLGVNSLGMTILERALQIGDALSNRDRLDALLTLCSLSKQMAGRYAKEYFDLYATPELERPESSHIFLLHNFALWGVEWRSKQISDLAVTVLNRDPVGFDSFGEGEQLSLEAIRRFAQGVRDLSFAPSQAEMAFSKGTLQFLSNTRRITFSTFPANYARTMQIQLAALLRRVAPHETRRSQGIGRNDLVTVNYDGEQRTGKYKKFQADLEEGKCLLISRQAASR